MTKHQNQLDSVAVTSRSFSRNPTLREKLQSQYKNVTFNDKGASLGGQELVKFLKGHTKAITALETIDSSIIAQLPDLKVLSKYGVGIDMIDVQALKAADIRFAWTKGVNRRSVSELTLAMAISLLRKLPEAQVDVGRGFWRQHIGSTLTSKTVGIVGCGNIGKDLIRLLLPFQCRVLINDLIPMPDFAGAFDCEEVTLNKLLSESDVITLHVPLDDTTRGLIGPAEFASMKQNALVINASRGGVIDEQALLDSLDQGRLAGAALDVFAVEPPDTDVTERLINHPLTIVTPHIGGSAAEAILEMGLAAIRGLAENG